jgi:hypothetical protein
MAKLSAAELRPIRPGQGCADSGPRPGDDSEFHPNRASILIIEPTERDKYPWGVAEADPAMARVPVSSLLQSQLPWPTAR